MSGRIGHQVGAGSQPKSSGRLTKTYCWATSTNFSKK